MHSIQELGTQDVSENVQLGGIFSQRIRGPIPRNLVVPVEQLLERPPIIPTPEYLLPPKGTRRTRESMDGDNWGM